MDPGVPTTASSALGRRVRWPVLVAAILTFGTAAVDVTAVNRLGGMFASVMTGNLVLLGLGVARAEVAVTVSALASFGGYMAGAAIGVRLTTVDSGTATWPIRVTAALTLELVVLMGFSVAWEIVGGEPSPAAARCMLVAAAVAMGIQSAAMRALATTIATTFLNGTVTGIITSLATRRRAEAAAVIAVIALICGACAAGLLLRFAPAAIPGVTTLPVLVIVVLAAHRHWRRIEFD